MCVCVYMCVYTWVCVCVRVVWCVCVCTFPHLNVCTVCVSLPGESYYKNTSTWPDKLQAHIAAMFTLAGFGADSASAASEVWVCCLCDSYLYIILCVGVCVLYFTHSMYAFVPYYIVAFVLCPG